MQFDTIRREDPFRREESINYNQPVRTDGRTLPKTSNECPDCKDKGIVKEPNGSVHTCWKCLESGRLDVHSKNLPKNDEVKL
jgi:hypothetical protein